MGLVIDLFAGGGGASTGIVTAWLAVERALTAYLDDYEEKQKLLRELSENK